MLLCGTVLCLNARKERKAAMPLECGGLVADRLLPSHSIPSPSWGLAHREKKKVGRKLLLFTKQTSLKGPMENNITRRGRSWLCY